MNILFLECNRECVRAPFFWIKLNGCRMLHWYTYKILVFKFKATAMWCL